MSSQTVLAQRAVDAAQVVEEIGAETLACVGGDRVLGGGAQHFEGFAVVLPEVLNVCLQILGTWRLQWTEYFNVYRRWRERPATGILCTCTCIYMYPHFRGEAVSISELSSL